MSNPIAKQFLNVVIFFSHGCINFQPVEKVFRQTIENLDSKPVRYHRCSILKEKHNLLSCGEYDHLYTYLVFKILNDLSPPPLGVSVTLLSISTRTTRVTVIGDLALNFRQSTFNPSTFFQVIYSSVMTGINDQKA